MIETIYFCIGFFYARKSLLHVDRSRMLDACDGDYLYMYIGYAIIFMVVLLAWPFFTSMEAVNKKGKRNNEGA